MRYCVIGPTPPPLGGVSVYISRLTRKLRGEGHTVVNLDMAGASAFRKAAALAAILFDPRRTVFHLHAFDFSAMAAMLMRPFPKRIVYMDHGTPLYRRRLDALRQFFLSRILSGADELYFISEHGRQFYLDAGFTLTPNLLIQNAFLPPHLEEEASVLATYSGETMQFMQDRSPLLVGNASAILFYNGIDLYGLDLCIELTARLKSDFPQAGFLFAIANDRTNADYIQAMKKRTADLGIAGNFHFFSGQRELWPVFRKADLIVRPTSEDGYGISLAEALFLGCDALASDVTARPPGTRLFRNRDLDDLHEQALRILRERADAGAQRSKLLIDSIT